MTTLLIADDEQAFLDLMVRLLQKEHNLLIARNWNEVLEKFEANLWRLNATILDVNMPGLSVDPFAMVEKLLKSNPTVPMVVMSGEDIVLKHDFLKMGIFQYLSKPLDMMDFKVTIESAVKYNLVLRQLENFKKQERDEVKYYLSLLNVQVEELAETIASHDVRERKAPILIRAEPGSRPEMLARVISQEIDGKLFFQKVCTPTLKNVIPYNVQHGDVLFLEGLEHLGQEELVALQDVLDRLLQPEQFNGQHLPPFRLMVSVPHQVERLFGSNPALAQVCERLNKLEFRIDPLRLRKHELPEIITLVFERQKKKRYAAPESISEDLLNLMVEYNWPLNYDELEIIIDSLLLTCPDRTLLPKHLHQLDFSDIANSRYPTLDDMVEEHIKKALRVTMGNKSKAAKMLGITPKTLYARIRN